MADVDQPQVSGGGYKFSFLASGHWVEYHVHRTLGTVGVTDGVPED